MTDLYLIRHGQAISNVEPIIGGMRGDTGLTPLGVRQAELLRDRLAQTREITGDVLIASDLARARQTAQIIAPALGLPIIYDPDIQEQRPGEADGLSHAEAKARYGMLDVQRDPFRPIFPGGESWPQFMVRVGSALDRITRQYAGKSIVLVTHGGFIDGAFIYFMGLHSFHLPPVGFHTHNTAITHWHYLRKEGWIERWWLEFYNDATHARRLKDEAQDKPAVPVPTEETGDG